MSKSKTTEHFILYVADNELFQAGPFVTEENAVKWAKQAHKHEFDIFDAHVYLQQPDGRLRELYAIDIGA